LAHDDTARSGGIHHQSNAGARASGPDHFARLDLPRGFALDPARLEKAYFEAQRRFHPDRFATRPAAERVAALQEATAVNEAYEVLKTPLGRAEHLLELAGRRLPGGDGATVSDPALLMDALEWREALADAEDAEAVERVRAEARQRIAGLVSALGAAFEAHDLDQATKLALSLVYLEKLSDEARRRAATLAAPKRAAS
jgi:molecular chaperone HscB